MSNFLPSLSLYSNVFFSWYQQLSKGSGAGCDQRVWTRNDQHRWSTERNQAAGQEETDGLPQTLHGQCLKAHLSLSLLDVSACASMCPSGPRLKVIKTLFCSYINTCIYSLSLCFPLMKGGLFPWTLLSHLGTSKAGLLGGRQDQLLIRKLHAVETAGLGRGGGKRCYLKATPSGQQRGKADKETGSVAGGQR